MFGTENQKVSLLAGIVKTKEEWEFVFPFIKKENFEDKNIFEPVEETVYLTPRRNKSRVFDFIRCEYKPPIVTDEKWLTGFLVAYHVSASHIPFDVVNLNGKRHNAEDVRIPMFGPNNPPPIDTLAVNTFNRKLQHFKKYEGDKAIFATTVEGVHRMGSPFEIAKEYYSFVGFGESPFELWNEK